MISYNDEGIIEVEKMSVDDLKDYLNANFVSFVQNDEVKLEAKMYGEAIDYVQGFKFPAEIGFSFEKLLITIKWQADFIRSATGTDIFIQELQYGKIELNTKLFSLHKIVHVCYGNESFAFVLANADDFNKYIVCTEYMKKLITEAINNNKLLLKPSNIISFDEERGKYLSERTSKLLLEQQQESEEVQMEEERQLELRSKISNFKKKFLQEYRCPRCGNSNKWYDMDLDVDNDGDFQFSASCNVCDRLVYEYGNIHTYQIQYTPDPPIQNAPWNKKYLSHPCPYCGSRKVRYAKWDDKGFSVAFWGFFSHKLHSNYKCDNCGEMWE